MLDLDYYNIEGAFAQIEEELISSMMRNMKRHTMQEVEEGKEWAQWQAVCLAELEEYKAANRTRFKREFSEINTLLEEAITQAREDGALDQEAEILEAIKNGYGYYRPGDAVNGRFFQVNDRKMEALIKATTHDMKRAEVAMLRRANDQYRKIIYATQVHMASGMTTYEKAVDMAARDFLMQGINCVKYKNGSVHNIKDYAGMVLRTTTKRAYLTGEGEMRQSWGMHLVIINKRGNACPLCAPFVGKVMIDDVWSGGKPDGKHLLMSNAMAAGLYHPNCRDSHTTYFGEEEDPYTKEEREELLEQTKQQSKQQYAKRQEKKYERLETYALDESNQKKYAARKKEWNAVARENVEERLKSLEKEFSNVTEGYSYDDFMKDFGSVEEGFDGAGEEEIKKAKEIADEIKELKAGMNIEKKSRSKEEAIHALDMVGIELKDKSVGVSADVMNKFADFITGFEQNHAGYFVKNELQLHSITIVDDFKAGLSKTPAGAYFSEGKAIKLRREAIMKKPGSLVTYSKSDDYQMHFLAHEYGHYVADSLEKTVGIKDYDIAQKCILKYFDGDIFKAANLSNLPKEFGSYGKTGGLREVFAEAFAEAYTCEKPGKLASIFKEELESLLDVRNNQKKGLSAKIGGNKIPLHEEPIILNKNVKDLNEEIGRYEARAIKDEYETALVYTKDGELYKCFGVQTGVFPDYDLHDKIEGATISHNHPIAVTEFSFSNADIDLFEKYSLEVLRGCDEKYTYELTRNAEEIDDVPDDWQNFENFRHVQVINIAQKHGIGYRRWKNDKKRS